MRELSGSPTSSSIQAHRAEHHQEKILSNNRIHPATTPTGKKVPVFAFAAIGVFAVGALTVAAASEAVNHFTGDPENVASSTSAVDIAADRDGQFVAELEAKGITFLDNTPSVAARTGRAVCSDLDAGNTPTQLADTTVTVSRQTSGELGLTYSQAEAQVAISVAYYCPEYSDYVGSELY